MRLRLTSALWVLAVACGPGSPSGDAGLDVPPDAEAIQPRPDHAPVLEPTCGARVSSADDRTTFDTREELARAVAEAECAARVRCNAAVLAGACDPLTVLPGGYDAAIELDAAEACLRAWDAWACDDPVAIYDTCRTLAPGVLPDGAPCSDDRQCEHRCVSPGGETCGGICGIPSARTCAPACVDGEWCSPDGCLPLPVVSEPCRPTCEGCPLELPCLGDALCEGVCIPLPRDGEPCHHVPGIVSDAYACASGLTCDLDEVCRPTRIVGDGEPCGGAALCEGPLFCYRFDLRCRGPAREGEACDPYHGALRPQCEDGTFCAGADPNVEGTCTALLPAGAPCDRDACLPPFTCQEDPDVAGGARCALAAGPGCACDDAHLCASGFACVEGSCRLERLRGGACARDTDCAFDQACVEGACRRATLGQPCTDEHRCAEGWCSEQDPRSSSRGICRPWRALGETCRSDLPCGEPDVCRGGLCRYADAVVLCE